MTRIVEDSPDRILIEDRPIVLSLIVMSSILFAVFLMFTAWTEGNKLLGLCALFLGAGGSAAFLQVLRLTRLTLFPDGSATLWSRDLRGTYTRRFPPGTLRAGVESHRMDQTATTRPVLLIDGAEQVERLPLSPYFSSSRRAADVVARIMDWRAAL